MEQIFDICPSFCVTWLQTWKGLRFRRRRPQSRTGLIFILHGVSPDLQMAWILNFISIEHVTWGWCLSVLYLKRWRHMSRSDSEAVRRTPVTKLPLDQICCYWRVLHVASTSLSHDHQQCADEAGRPQALSEGYPQSLIWFIVWTTPQEQKITDYQPRILRQTLQWPWGCAETV